MIEKILTYMIIRLDSLYRNRYPKSKNKIAIELVTDYSNGHNGIFLNDFIEARGHWTLQELYTIINDFYNSKLSEFIVEWDDLEISRLKYLKIILLEIKETLINNSKPNG